MGTTVKNNTMSEIVRPILVSGVSKYEQMYISDLFKKRENLPYKMKKSKT